jgi:hypothetical protein
MKRGRCAIALLAGLIATSGFEGGERTTLMDVRPFIPEVVAAGEGEVFRGAFAPGGTEFYFFRKVTRGEEDYRIFRTERTETGWSDAQLMPFGDAAASSMYPAVSPDGSILVFASVRGPEPWTTNANLWAAVRGAEGWSEPRVLAAASTPTNYDAAPWFDPDGRLRFTSTTSDWSRTMHRRVNGPVLESRWSEDPLWEQFAAALPDHHVWSGMIDPTGRRAVIEVAHRRADGTLANSDLWVASHSTGRWSRPSPLGSLVNTDSVENFPAFTPDGSTLIFVRDFAGFYSVSTDAAWQAR